MIMFSRNIIFMRVWKEEWIGLSFEKGNGFGNARLRSSVCRQGRMTLPRRSEAVRNALFWQTKRRVKIDIGLRLSVLSWKCPFHNPFTQNIFGCPKNEIIENNPSEHFCGGKEYLLIANALSIMQKQMLKKKDVHKNAHSPKKGLTSERMFDIIYRTNVRSKSGKCFQTLRHSEQQH